MKSTANLPSPFPGIYETLYPYQQHISFKKYNPSKPGKYGVLHCSLCDASVPYTYYSLIYAENPDVIDDETDKYCVESSKPGKYGVLYSPYVMLLFHTLIAAYHTLEILT